MALGPQSSQHLFHQAKNNRSMCLPRKVLVLNSGKKIGGGNLYCISCHAPARRNPST
ncbi:hypothetical protein PCASD_25925 [Puccinia coronata f. sp. avenae]|uniref:Uncharacterized protein n=1 Tax=Puccinia coronata f. sp. avenae TaxID=200324 RepID=A0A2N5TIB9_9BASI|nr:hypothetical protein PCASD_25297 [Puccinia coronata f. sp. avenae]PLW25230.1 hypothetical protein PCASD_25301 [Puccinia coronata f. sp. avenae]PLW25627.1 hypothetical protein PCASD_25925 [Puccinia coronata f. sp. avenae]